MNTRDLDRIRAVRLAAANGQAREIRLGAGATQGEVAGPVNVSPSTIALWESGKRIPRGEAALRYADVLESLSREPLTTFVPAHRDDLRASSA